MYANQTQDVTNFAEILGEKPKVKDTPYKWFPTGRHPTEIATFYSNVERETFSEKVKSLYEKVIRMNEVNFICKICKKETKKSNKMTEHVETHIKGIIFKCSLCDLICTSSRSIKKHYYKHNNLEFL